VKEEYDYVIDPHTACGFQDLDLSTTHIVLATAHPAKFPDIIREAIGETPTDPSLEAIRKKKMVAHPVGATPSAVRKFLEEKGL
jgi:threonine synthase